MYSNSRGLSILTLVFLAALYLPMAEAKGGGGGGGGTGKAAGAAGGFNSRTNGVGPTAVGGYGGGNYGTTPAAPDPQSPKKANEATDTSNYGRGTSK